MAAADPRRSEAQNRKWRAMLTDISRCCPDGRRLTPDQWAILLFAAWDHDRRFGDLQLMEGLEGRPPVPVNGYSTSILTVSDMAELITFALEYGDRNEVRWSGGDYDVTADPLMQARMEAAAAEFTEAVRRGASVMRAPRCPGRIRDPLMREAAKRGL